MNKRAVRRLLILAAILLPIFAVVAFARTNAPVPGTAVMETGTNYINGYKDFIGATVDFSGALVLGLGAGTATGLSTNQGFFNDLTHTLVEVAAPTNNNSPVRLADIQILSVTGFHIGMGSGTLGQGAPAGIIGTITNIGLNFIGRRGLTISNYQDATGINLLLDAPFSGLGTGFDIHVSANGINSPSNSVWTSMGDGTGQWTSKTPSTNNAPLSGIGAISQVGVFDDTDDLIGYSSMTYTDANKTLYVPGLKLGGPAFVANPSAGALTYSNGALIVFLQSSGWTTVLTGPSTNGSTVYTVQGAPTTAGTNSALAISYSLSPSFDNLQITGTPNPGGAYQLSFGMPNGRLVKDQGVGYSLTNVTIVNGNCINCNVTGTNANSINVFSNNTFVGFVSNLNFIATGGSSVTVSNRGNGQVDVTINAGGAGGGGTQVVINAGTCLLAIDNDGGLTNFTWKVDTQCVANAIVPLMTLSNVLAQGEDAGGLIATNLHTLGIDVLRGNNPGTDASFSGEGSGIIYLPGVDGSFNSGEWTLRGFITNSLNYTVFDANGPTPHFVFQYPLYVVPSPSYPNTWTVPVGQGDQVLSSNQVVALISDIPLFEGIGTTGLVTSTSGDAGKYLRADGSWQANGTVVTNETDPVYASTSNKWAGVNQPNTFSTSNFFNGTVTASNYWSRVGLHDGTVTTQTVNLAGNQAKVYTNNITGDQVVILSNAPPNVFSEVDLLTVVGGSATPAMTFSNTSGITLALLNFTNGVNLLAGTTNQFTFRVWSNGLVTATATLSGTRSLTVNNLTVTGAGTFQGNVNVTGTVSAGTLSGNGGLITALNAGSLTVGTIPTARYGGEVVLTNGLQGGTGISLQWFANGGTITATGGALGTATNAASTFVSGNNSNLGVVTVIAGSNITFQSNAQTTTVHSASSALYNTNLSTQASLTWVVSGGNNGTLTAQLGNGNFLQLNGGSNANQMSQFTIGNFLNGGFFQIIPQNASTPNSIGISMQTSLDPNGAQRGGMAYYAFGGQGNVAGMSADFDPPRRVLQFSSGTVGANGGMPVAFTQNGSAASPSTLFIGNNPNFWGIYIMANTNAIAFGSSMGGNVGATSTVMNSHFLGIVAAMPVNADMFIISSNYNGLVVGRATSMSSNLTSGTLGQSTNITDNAQYPTNRFGGFWLQPLTSSKSNMLSVITLDEGNNQNMWSSSTNDPTIHYSGSTNSPNAHVLGTFQESYSYTADGSGNVKLYSPILTNILSATAVCSNGAALRMPVFNGAPGNSNETDWVVAEGALTGCVSCTGTIILTERTK